MGDRIAGATVRFSRMNDLLRLGPSLKFGSRETAGGETRHSTLCGSNVCSALEPAIRRPPCMCRPCFAALTLRQRPLSSIANWDFRPRQSLAKRPSGLSSVATVTTPVFPAHSSLVRVRSRALDAQRLKGRKDSPTPLHIGDVAMS